MEITRIRPVQANGPIRQVSNPTSSSVRTESCVSATGVRSRVRNRGRRPAAYHSREVTQRVQAPRLQEACSGPPGATLPAWPATFSPSCTTRAATHAIASPIASASDLGLATRSCGTSLSVFTSVPRRVSDGPARTGMRGLPTTPSSNPRDGAWAAQAGIRPAFPTS